VVELKTVEAAVVRSYLRAIGRRMGSGKPTLEAKRILAPE